MSRLIFAARPGWLMLALCLLLPLAAQAEDADALSYRGRRYDNGIGVPRDGAKAQQFYIAAARANSISAKNNLAYLWARQNGLLEEALCLSAATLQAQPHNAYYLDTYGLVLMRLGRLDEAQHFFDKSLEEFPDYDDPLEHSGDIAYRRDDTAAANDFWKRSLRVARNEHQEAHLGDKLAGKPDDYDAHPPFPLDAGGFGKNCATPTV